MIKGLNFSGQEDFIWAMRSTSVSRPDTRASSVQLSFSSNTEKKFKYTPAPINDYQTRVMASLVPDEVICNVDNYKHRHYDACFLFGDVSGFTDLCEKYTQTGVSGPSRMTQVLNKYLGSMVQEVMSHNGDVLKFSGDAFLAVFKVSETETMHDVVHEALDCALIIQKNYGSYLTDVGIEIRVKLAISAGLATFALIGNKTASHYVVVGKPIWDVKAAESISSAGDIVVAPAAWQHVNTNEYIYEEIQNSVHIKLLGVGASWRSVQKNLRQQKKPDHELDSVDAEELSQVSEALSDMTQEGGDEFSVRPAVNLAVKLRMTKSLRRFIIAPVMKSIDKGEPFEYLTETRQTVIVFINVVSFTLTTVETVILADQTYKIVCRIVDKMKGCVNKVSLFDKDLMFVVVFGLRGLKHELECQMALRCATACHKEIEKLPGVLSTSIGVTTGKTYCGVFGHTLRREYTVISLIVNKAARLMVAYKGKVTCDRETFLHSKLESRHFILLEYKPLKGISHPGPVYEFREVEKHHRDYRRINTRPMLGRGDKIKLYLKHLEEFTAALNDDKDQQCKMLVIQGEAGLGKTRLLDELVYTTQEDISINKFTLTEKDLKIPYQTARLIFNLPLSLTLNSSEKEKEEKLLSKLTHVKSLDLICVLNDVFGVNFQKPDVYLAMQKTAREVALAKMMKQLADTCFVTLWVIFIDDIEFIDVWSWNIVKYLLDIKTVFFVGGMSRDKLNRSKVCTSIVQDPRVQVTALKPLDRWYLGALACQILQVYALSPELENAIQTRSNGNPGWIESFLITLIQDKALYIIPATMQQINDLGLVCPPLYMMARLTPEETAKWQSVMEEKKEIFGTDSIDHWQKYIDSCRESYLNVTIREQMEALSKDGKVPICVIAPDFHIPEDEIEMSMDAIILRTFDSLYYFEQLLVKCSATLGSQFLREMLLYVIMAENKRAAALAVQKLFEIKVLTCAKGNFLEGQGYIFQGQLTAPGTETEPTCQCRGLKIDPQCVDLPKYASCGFLQFQSSQFREITYNLLTDQQKKEFHQRAIKYLEQQTRKCKSCGGDLFEQIVGPKSDKDLMTIKNKDNPMSLASTGDFTGSNSPRLSVYSTTGSIASVGAKKGDKLAPIIPSQIFAEARVERAHRSLFGFSIINKMKSSFSLTRDFAGEDYTHCQCSLILSTTYAQLIDHASGAGDVNKLIEAMLEYARICIVLSNIPLAIKQLTEALEVLNRKSLEETENPWKLSLIRAKIYILLGYSQLELGYLEDAGSYLHSALAQYNITFPKGINRSVMSLGLKLKHLFGMYVFPNSLVKNMDHWGTIYSNNLSECLSHLCTLYTITGKWKDAEVAACWSLTKCLQAFSDFQLICTACANMLQVLHLQEKWKMCIGLEVHSLRLCHMKQQFMEVEDLRCVAKLYSIIFKLRIHRNDMERGIHIGYILLRMAPSIRAFKLVLPVLPLLLHSLLNGKHFSNVYSILEDIKYFAEEESDYSGRIWYYTLCMVVQMETGFSVVSYAACEHFYQIECERWGSISDVEAKKRFYAVMWLWCLRNEKWEAASLWSLKNVKFAQRHDEDAILNDFTALYLLEGMLILYVYQMDKLNVEEAANTETTIKKFISTLEKSARTTKFIVPRLLHLKAYYKFIKSDGWKVTEMLDKASASASKYGNALEDNYIEHSRKAWKKLLSPALAEFWRDHCEADLLDFQDINVSEKVGFFTLPTPMFFYD